MRHVLIGPYSLKSRRPDARRTAVCSSDALPAPHRALQSNDGLRFHPIDDDRLIAYSKRSTDGADVIVTIVNLDPHSARSGTLELPLADLGIEPDRVFEAVDLLGGSTYLWHGPHNRVELDPAVCPAAILHLQPRIRTEAEFEHYL